MSDEFEEFKTEILEMLDRAEQALLGFDQLPENQSSHALYDEVFRAYHNIKGAAGMMEWEQLQHHVHQLENVLMESKGTSSIPKHLISWFLKGNDATRSIMSNTPYHFSYELPSAEKIVSTPTPTPTPQEVVKTNQEMVLPEEFYADVNEGLERISSALIKMEAGAGDKALVDSLYRDIHSIKGAVQLFGLEGASHLSHGMENSLEHVRNMDKYEIDNAHVSTLLLCVDLMNLCVKKPNDEEIVKEAKFMVKLLAPFSELTPERKVETPVSSEVKTEIKPEVKPEVKMEVKPSPKPEIHSQVTEAKVETDTTIRVQVSLLDRLMTLMGEMVLVRNQVLQYSNNCDDLEFLNLSQKLDVVTSELQEETMKTRMQPIGNVLNKFQRVVRDLSGTLNKKINLVLIGVETELDKSLIEAVKDPLMHIVRNACDHGIETPDMRSGKPETGTITIKAYHEGGQVIVDISDDGKGLSRKKLLQKAVEKGIITAEKGELMSDRDVQNLIFAPGFSTAEKVTNVSGRGVGMDVVKSNIEKIGGLVDISSTEGVGSKITLKIPLTLAIVPAMIVRTDHDRYAIPQVKLVELVRVEKHSLEYVQGRPVYRLRGNILPLVSLKEILGTPAQQDNDEAINIVVLNSESHLFGMIVDEILDTADIVVKPLARFLKSISLYSGATVLGDGSVAFILDVLGIAQKHLGTGNHQDSKNVKDKYSSLGEDSSLREFVLVGLASKAKHAIPLSAVSRMEEIKTSSIELSGNQRVIRYRGGILRIVSLNEVLGYKEEKVEKEITQLIVTRTDDEMVGIEVNQIIDVLSTRDYLDETLSAHEAITGNLVTSSEIIVVVNVDKIYDISRPKVRAKDVSNKSAKVLVVEDTASIRMRIVQYLTENGFEVEVAVDGIDGLKKIADNKFNFDVIISDIEMPRMDGIDFVKKVRSIERMKSIPVIAFTTKNSSEDLDRAKMAGFTTYLEKSKGRLLPLLVSECLNDNKRKTA